MSFPEDPIDLTVELRLDGFWQEITDHVQRRDSMVITRGRSDEAGDVERSTCKFTVNNRDALLSPRNPFGAYYGSIGRNTLMRVRTEPAADTYLLVPDSASSMTTPDSTGLSITGDIDVRVDIQRANWSQQKAVAGKFEGTGNQRSWAFYVNANKTLRFVWSPTGTSSVLEDTSTTGATVSDGDRLAIRVTLDVNNGAAGHTTTFYTAPTMAGPWTQLGSPVVTAGTTSIFDSSAVVEVGDVPDLGVNGMEGRVYGFELYSGIGGTLKGDLNFEDTSPEGDSINDSLGNIWTTSGRAIIVAPSIRFVGEVSEWPPRRDKTGQDVYTPLEASGILRRLTQGESPLRSALFRGYQTASFTPKAYWPCEDGEDSRVISSGIEGHPPMTTLATGGTTAFPDFASNSEFVCSDPLPTMSETEWTGAVPGYTATGDIQVFLLIKIPEGGVTDGEGLFTLYTSGTARRWSVLYGTGGNLTLKAFDDTGTQLLTNTTAFDVDGRLLRMDLELHETGGNVEWDLATLEVGESVGGVQSGTLNTNTVGRGTAVVVNPGAELDDVVVGHISVHDSIRSLFDLFEELNAYKGETAGRRIERLCEEEGVSFRAIGDLDATTTMGFQRTDAFTELLKDAAAADGGILHERRDGFGLAYRTRESLYSQDVALALDYSLAHLSSFEPTDDDRLLRNDITVKREGGGQGRAVKSSGPLSIMDPPDGVGRYDDQVTLNLEDDGQLADAAGWRLFMGTVDELRFPVLAVELHRSVFATDSDLSDAALDLDIGDLLTIDNPPDDLPPEQISQLAQGFTETISNFERRIDINCSPGTPWSQVATWDDDLARYTSDGTTLAEDLTSGETGVDVSTPTGPKWSHDDGDFDIIIGGEVMTVTAISGSGDAQTFTVTRAVNSVVKAHDSGAAVELFRPSVYVE